MGPFELPAGTTYLTVEQRQELLQRYGVSAVVRQRSNWSGRSLSLSGPAAHLEEAYAAATRLLGVEGQALPAVGKAEPKAKARRARQWTAPPPLEAEVKAAAFQEGAKWAMAQGWQPAPAVYYVPMGVPAVPHQAQRLQRRR